MTLPMAKLLIASIALDPVRLCHPNSVTRISIWLKKRYTKHLPQQSSSGRGKVFPPISRLARLQGRFKAIDTIRRTRFNTSVTELSTNRMDKLIH